MENTASASLTHPATVSAQKAPSAMTSSHLDLVRLYMVREYPAFIRLRTMDLPMMPTPINAIFLPRNKRKNSFAFQPFMA